MRWYTYVYYDEEHQPYYVGKGCARRAYERRAIPVPPRERMVFRYFDEEERAFQLEKDLIAFWGRKDLDPSGRLMNIALGGPGLSGVPPSKKRSKASSNTITSYNKSELCKLNNQRSKSKDWVVVSPAGDTLKITNLNKFCTDNNLDTSNMHAVARGKRAHSQGWKCRHA